MHERRLQLPSGLGVALLEAGGPPARPLLLVHGFTGAKEDFAEHLDALAATGWHCVAPDLRGHGGSDHPPGVTSYGLRIFAADILGLADALGWARFTLLGHSMGGMVAQHIALDAPDRLERLVLMDTSHGAPDGIDPALVELGKAVVAQGGMPLLVEATRAQEGGLFTPAHMRLLSTRPGYREFAEGKSLACSADMWTAMVDEFLHQPDRLQALAGLRLPTLVVVGEQDASFLDHSRRMAGAIPDAKLAVIADAGHSPQFENPTGWFEAVVAFLDGGVTVAGQ
ncbi:MAG: alpha/beta hydrolase [Actinobacteria bacterium]|nr:alpha/beta hydrolase [Actinomycetota bacterium]